MGFDTTDKPRPAPTTGPAAFDAQQRAFDTGYGALGKQQQIAGQAPDVWASIGRAHEAQTEAGMDALRQQAARGLTANRGSLGGGGGLAAVQQANAANAYNVAQYGAQANAQRAQLGAQSQQAQMQAQGQIAQAAGGQYRMLQDQQQRQIRSNAALDAARAIMQRNAGTVYTTASDKAKAAQQIQKEVLATETDPVVIAAVQDYIRQLGSGNYDTPNSIDV